MLMDILCDLLLPAFGIVLVRRMPKPLEYGVFATVILFVFATALTALTRNPAVSGLWILFLFASPVVALLLTGIFSALHTADEFRETQIWQFVIVCLASGLTILMIVAYCLMAGVDLAIG